MCDGDRLTVEPPFAVEPHLWGPDACMAEWLCDPPGVVIQFVKPARGSLALAEWLVGPAFEHLSSHHPAEQRFMAVLDLALMNGRSAAARMLLIRQALGIGRRFSHFFVVPPLVYPPMYLRAFRETVALARSLGVNVLVASSSRAVVEEYALRPLVVGEVVRSG